MRVRCRRLPHADGLPLPAAASEGSAGFDLFAAVDEADGGLELAPGDRALVPTGLVLELPEGTEGQVRPRSGLALRHGVTILNAPGTIDSDFRGELAVLLVNLGDEPYVVRRGDRIAQLVVARLVDIELEPADELVPSRRDAGGFGSTGR